MVFVNVVCHISTVREVFRPFVKFIWKTLTFPHSFTLSINYLPRYSIMSVEA
jgi:hypothetical protein